MTGGGISLWPSFAKNELNIEMQTEMHGQLAGGADQSTTILTGALAIRKQAGSSLERLSVLL